MMNEENKFSDKVLADVTGGGWEEKYEQGYDQLQHDLNVATYLGEFYQKLTNEGKRSARAYYNSIQLELSDRDKALFQNVFGSDPL